MDVDEFVVQPRWVVAARDGCPLRCVQYSADLARDVGVLLQEWKAIEQHHTNVGFKLWFQIMASTSSQFPNCVMWP